MPLAMTVVAIALGRLLLIFRCISSAILYAYIYFSVYLIYQYPNRSDPRTFAVSGLYKEIVPAAVIMHQ